MNTPRILTRRIAAAAAVLLFTPALHALDRYWVDADGGTFSIINSWSATAGGAGGASVPVAVDFAFFTLNSTYTVAFGVAATNTLAIVENGNVTFDLNGFAYTLTAAGGTQIGTTAGQTGRLTVRDGILAVDTTGDDVLIGQVAGSTGFLTISTGGRLGNGTNRPDLFIGSTGAGTLTVNDNGRVDADVAFIGNNAGSAGTMTITGPNAVVDVSNNIAVGSSGAGTVTISNGGTLAIGSIATLGSNLGADGTVTVTGAGSSWTNASTITIGSSGDGTLNVTSGGLATFSGSATLGSNATGVGTATVSGAGSRWEIVGAQTIGNIGLGVMTVSSGGVVTGSNSATLGVNSGGEGRATITGDGSQWTMSSGLTVGSSGTGELTISAGGEVSASTVILGNGGSGTATVTGAGSKLTSTANLAVGNLGTGTLNVASGAEVHVAGGLNVVDAAGAQVGTLNLDGGSIFVAGNFTNNSVFNFTDGLLRVAGNFQPSVAVNPLVINGGDSGDLPVLELLGGAGTNANILGVTVGSNQRGELRLRQGRLFSIGANVVAIGALVGGEGTVSVESGAQFLTNNIFAVGGSLGTAGGSGTLNIAGGTVDTATLRIFSGGTVNLSSGTLAVDSAPTLDGQFNWTGGTLRFDAAFSLTSTNVPKLLGTDGTIRTGRTLASAAGVSVTLNTPVIVDGGTLSVGNALLNNSTLEVRSGSATVAGGILNTAGAQLFVERNLSFGTALTIEIGARLELTGGTGRLLGAGFVGNNGLITGHGTISNSVANGANGKIRVDAGKTLFLTGAFGANDGHLNLQGGTLDFANAITNSATGFISGRGALYTAGLTNNGAMAFSGGITDLHGGVANAVGGRIVTSGAGSTTTFFDDLAHNGTEIFTGANASTVIFGASTGAGPFTGTGTVYSIGDLRPGNSPATVSYGGSLVLGNGTLTMEIGGLSEGTQYDSLHIASSLYADGTLSLSLFGGYSPVLGAMFDLYDAASITGTFDSLSLPSLAPNLTWDTSALYTTGTVSVISSLPPIQQWRLDFFGSSANAGNGANLVDFDLDGIRNLAEYGLGTDPLIPTSTGLPFVSIVTVGPNHHAAITFTRPLSATDVNHLVEISSDLATWLPGSSYSAGGDVPSNANTTQHSRTDDGTLETIIVRANTTTTASPANFLRVRVTHPTE